MFNTSQLQHLHELILNAAGEGICGFNCQGRVTFINPAAVAMLGWPEQTPDGQTIHDIFGLESGDAEAFCPVRNIVCGKNHYQAFDQPFKRYDVSQFPVDFVSTPVIEQGEIKGVVLVFQDITDRKLADEKLQLALRQIRQLKNRLQEENYYLQEQMSLDQQFKDILGDSTPMKAVLSLVSQVAATDTTVLVLGETGTGKELFACALHDLSRRRQRPLVKVNCAALPASLIESELFGHEKGSFTGAIARRTGRFELADQGTIFLDEIGELPLTLQAKLLRVLQEGEIERVGGSTTLKIDVRVIAATHRDLRQMVASGQFREDLYYRLSVFPLTVPPLRDRRQDISLLARYFARKYAQKTGKKITEINEKALKNLQSYHWPGNVRELENVIERAVILSTSYTLNVPTLVGSPESSPAGDSERLSSMTAMERNHIIAVLEHTGWRIAGERGAAAVLEMHPNTLRSRMNKLGIRRN